MAHFEKQKKHGGVYQVWKQENGDIRHDYADGTF